MAIPVSAPASNPVPEQSTFRRVWTMPLLLAALTVFGLLAALLGTGVWHVLAWGALAAPILAVPVFAVMRSRKSVVQ